MSAVLFRAFQQALQAYQAIASLCELQALHLSSLLYHYSSNISLHFFSSISILVIFFRHQLSNFLGGTFVGFPSAVDVYEPSVLEVSAWLPVIVAEVAQFLAELFHFYSVHFNHQSYSL